MPTGATSPVVVIYEDAERRQMALSFCDRMVERFWNQLSFDINWWSFDLLQEAESASEAVDQAAVAAVIVFAAQPEGDLPLHVLTWIETWLLRRGEREGALVGLTNGGGAAVGRQLHFRKLAHRAGLDYLTQVPESLPYPAAGAPEAYSNRADQVTGLLQDILAQPSPPAVDPLDRPSAF